MLFGGNSGSCGGCGCKSCQECTRGCTEPHTGTAFETVYTLYFEGAEAGNPSDDYLEATGDVDTSDPYDGMDGTGPWSQTVSGTFTLTKTTTRYPCVVTVSFWRSNFVLGANTTPPPATTLTEERITVTNSVLSEGAIYAGGFLLQPGESHQFDTTIPLVAGSGDQSSSDPRSFLGVMRVSAACANDYVSFTVSGHIEWNVQKRQHVLYGLVRECYEEPGSDVCAGRCTSPSVVPDELYVTLSNLSFTNAKYNYAGDLTQPGPADTVYTPAILAEWQSLLTAAVATVRVTHLCTQWNECLDASGGLCAPCVTVIYDDIGIYGYGGLSTPGVVVIDNLSVSIFSTVNYQAPGVLGGCNEWVNVHFTLGEHEPCTPFDMSGSATGKGIITSNRSGYGGISFDASCDWEITS